MTFAVINTGGKQYKVSANDKLRIEKLPEDEGKVVEFKEVLLINNDKDMELGSPLIEGAKVEGKIVKQTKNKKVIILGYGGASHAIHYVLKKRGFKDILIFNRSKKKIKYSKNTEYTKKYSDLETHLEGVFLIINTTPINPMLKKHLKLITKSTIVSDIVYSPKNTSFLKQFPKNKKIYGISMLIEQAKPCFKIWFGKNPSVDAKMLNAIYKKI